MRALLCANNCVKQCHYMYVDVNTDSQELALCKRGNGDINNYYKPYKNGG